jgi:hypothetical protein
MLTDSSLASPGHSAPLRSEIVLMTPQKAKEILTYKNGKNRYVRMNTVAKFVQDIKEGRWQVTHQGIAFDENGMLIDGQHRLRAISEGGKDCQIMVSYNVPRKSFSVLDCGVSRTASDNLAYINVPRAKIVAPGIKHVILYNRYPKRTWSNLPFPTHTEIANFYEKESELIDQLSAMILATHKQFKKVNPTALMAVCYLAAQANHDLGTISAFCHGLGKGAGLSSASPILKYRQFLINSNKIPAGKTLQQYSIACLIKVFNYWIQDVKSKQFKPPQYPDMPVINQAPAPNLSPLSAKVKELVLSRAQYVCEQCGIIETDRTMLQVDHIIQRSKGGSNEIKNLQCLCSSCNNLKSDNQ